MFHTLEFWLCRHIQLPTLLGIKPSTMHILSMYRGSGTYCRLKAKGGTDIQIYGIPDLIIRRGNNAIGIIEIGKSNEFHYLNCIECATVNTYKLTIQGQMCCNLVGSIYQNVPQNTVVYGLIFHKWYYVPLVHIYKMDLNDA